MLDTTVPRVPPRHQIRAVVWRLPLIAFLIIGIAVLRLLDVALVREYRKEAAHQAMRTAALLDSFLQHRRALLHSVQAMLADARSEAEARQRFSAFARELTAGTKNSIVLYLIDTSGVVIDVQRQSTAPRNTVSINHFSSAERSLALERARRTRGTAMTGTVGLHGQSAGVMVYDPIVRGKRVVGYVGAALPFQSVFEQAIAGQLEGKFGYRIKDPAGRVISESPQFPEHVASVEARDVMLEQDYPWRIEVPISPFEPLMPRAILWLVGVLLLLLVVFMVIREEARAHRFAAHSYDLELLSRDLLEANMRLEERASQVEEANRAKSRFLANVSHELRTPLNAIVGYNSLALEEVYGPLVKPMRAALERIGAASEHLLGIVEDVLDLSKIEVGRMDVERTPVDLAELLRNIVMVVEPSADAKNVRIDMVPPKHLPRLVTDARHVRQIVLNLVSNAIKFTEKGTVTIAAARVPAGQGTPVGVQVSVEDTGIGIAPEDQERIFDEFEQVRPSGRGDSQQRGTGLGLAIAKKLALLIGGDVTVESQLGVGSRFTLTLPLDTPATPNAELQSGTRKAAGDGSAEQSQEGGHEVAHT